LAYPSQQLEGVLEKVCSARGWNISDYVPTKIDGSEEVKLTTRLSEIKENGVFFSPRGTVFVLLICSLLIVSVSVSFQQVHFVFV
jgi:hypothetical protein